MSRLTPQEAAMFALCTIALLIVLIAPWFIF